MNYDCPDCREAVTRRRGKRALRRFNARSQGRPLLYTVVTIPLHRRAEFMDPVSWRKFRRRVWHLLRDRFGAELAIENSHPVGDPDESGEAGRFHPHLNFLWIAKKGFPPFVNVAVLRHRIRMILECDTEIDVYHRYFQRSNGSDASRRVAYALRNFPGWASWAGPAQWLGRIEKLAPDPPRPCPRCGEIPVYMCTHKFDPLDPEAYDRVIEEYHAQLERDRANPNTHSMEDVPHE